MTAPVSSTPAPAALASLTSLALGGPPRAYAVASTLDEVRAAIAQAHSLKLPLLPIGGGSNLVVHEKGVEAFVLSVDLQEISFENAKEVTTARVGAGVRWDDFVAESTRRNLQGVECLGGIPGNVGATPIQNVGAYGQEVAERIVEVRALDVASGEMQVFSNEQCEFSYRNSFFKRAGQGKYVVVEVSFALTPSGKPRLRYGELSRALQQEPDPSVELVRRTVVELRRRKSMVYDPSDENHRSCGSFFVNPVVSLDAIEKITKAAGAAPPQFPAPEGGLKVPAAWLIEQAGLSKGTRSGAVGLSTKHTLALVALDGASSQDIVEFAWFVRRRVLERFGVTLVPEPQFWGYAERGSFSEGLPTLEGEG